MATETVLENKILQQNEDLLLTVILVLVQNKPNFVVMERRKKPKKLRHSLQEMQMIMKNEDF